MTQSLSLYEKIGNPIEAVKFLGKTFAQSKMFGDLNESQGQLLAWACLAERTNPLEIMRKYHLIGNTLAKKADVMHAEFLNSGGKLQWVKSDAEECIIVLTHPDHAPDGHEVTVTRAELDRAGITGGNNPKKNWRQFPKRMLQCRAISDGVRQILPTIVCGVYTPEEISDFEQPVIPKKRTKETTKTIESSSRKKEDLKKIAEATEGIRDTFGPENVLSPQVQRVLDFFADYGCLITDLERFIVRPHYDWSEEDFESLREAAKIVRNSENPQMKIKELFGLEPGAQG